MPKTLSWDTSDTALSSLLQHPSTLIDRNRVNIDNTEFQYPRAKLIENSQMTDRIKGSAEINLHDPNLIPPIQCILHCMEHIQRASQVPRPLG